MKTFIVPSNPKIYKAREAFNKLHRLHWIQGNNRSVSVGDRIYIYESSPTSGIILEAKVIERDVQSYHIDDKEFSVGDIDFSNKGPWFTLEKVRDLNPIISLKLLHEVGIKGNIQSLREIDTNIVKEIEEKTKINFRKIPAKNLKITEVKERFKDQLLDIFKYVEHLSDQKGSSDSGAKTSYILYICRLIVLYEENFNDKITDLTDTNSYIKLDRLRSSPNFRAYNLSENRFPNAAINTFKKYLLSRNIIIEQQTDEQFNEQLLKEESDKKLSLITKPTMKPLKNSTKYGTSYSRSIDESLNAKIKSNWSCEYDESHQTFISETNKKPYIEAHHLIPMAAQDFYENTIDFSDNIISLCPMCHKKIHYGLNEEKESMIEFFFKKRNSLFPQYGINISLDELKEYYNL